MIPKNVLDALNGYCLSEFMHELNDENEENPEAIGIAFTEIYDENDEPCHTMQIMLNLPKLQFEYYLDEVIVHVEKCESENDIAEMIENTDFQDWYGDFLMYCPEDYH